MVRCATRAVSLYGERDDARRMSEELAEGFAAGMFTGGEGEGQEFLMWSGIPTGYEGTLILTLAPMYSIAIEHGILTPTTPEWWPEYASE